MPILQKSFLFWLCLSFFSMQFLYTSATAMAGVTRKEVQTVSSAEVKIPAETVTSSEKGSGNWLWAILGVALVGGAVAALSGGENGGGDDDDDCPSGNCSAASFEFSW